MAKPLTRPRSPWVIEFVGLPGAGKTTVFHQVALQLKAKGIAIVQRDELLQQWQNMHWLQRLLKLIPENGNQWNILIQSLRLAFQVKPWNQQSFLKAGKIFSNVKRVDDISRTRLCQVILLDQGLLQEAWSVGLTGTPPTPEHLQQRLAPLFNQRSIALVHFTIDLETALVRIKSRPSETSRFDLMPSEAAHSLLVRYAPYLQDIIACTQTVGTPVLDINSAHPIETNAEKITHWVADLVSLSTTH